MFFEFDIFYEDIYDDLFEGRFSGLEFVVDFDCGDSDSVFGEVIDEIEN